MTRKISIGDMKLPERMVSEDEIDLAIHQCNSEKAPCPDGLNVGVLKTLWNLLKDDMYSFIKIFMEKGVLPEVINSSFIALIPKADNPCKVSDYGPISLIIVQ